jgi:hypothetical protein
MMRALLVSAVPLLCSIAGCADRAPALSAPDAPSRVESGVPLASRPLPIKGYCELTFNPPPLPLPPVHRQIDTGTCWFSHLGRTAVYGVQDIDFAAGTQTGRRTFTAANGDTLYALNDGTSRPGEPGTVRFVTTITIVGGTGRFANATGQMSGEGTANLVAHTTTVTNEGWIAYDASDRSAR